MGVCTPAARVCGPRGDCNSESCTSLLDMGWTAHHDAPRPASGYCRDHNTDRSRGRAGWLAAPPRTSRAPPRIGGMWDGGRAASDLEGCGGLGAGDGDESGNGGGGAYEDEDQDEEEGGGWRRRRGTGWKGGRVNVWVCPSGAPLWSSPCLLVCHGERASRSFPGCACFAVVQRRAQPRRVSLWNTTTHPTTARRQSTAPLRTLAPHSLAPSWIARGALSAPFFPNAAALRMSPTSFPQTRTGGGLHYSSMLSIAPQVVYSFPPTRGSQLSLRAGLIFAMSATLDRSPPVSLALRLALRTFPRISTASHFGSVTHGDAGILGEGRRGGCDDSSASSCEGWMWRGMRVPMTGKRGKRRRREET
ncbi:hypothetical protein DFH08DRAFT_150777 [Mycena albidolilacea]|uniref:Uncharacterized protein n=1 Tax=Mycena albidolilacea TaxID=1033008 RepID=A0AAD7ET66_9AGAR|nr:hypothetical protein DFH08DRAFT_150777 [Mycena albidolilacea]